MLRSLVGSEMCIRDRGSKAWYASASMWGRRRKTRPPRPPGNRARYRARKRARLTSGPSTSRSAAALTEDFETSDIGLFPVLVPNVPGERSGCSCSICSSAPAPDSLHLSVACPIGRVRDWDCRPHSPDGDYHSASRSDQSISCEWYGPSRANRFRDRGCQTEQSVNPRMSGSFVESV